MDDMICLYRNKDGSTDIYDWEGNKEGIIINDKVISHNSSENFAPELGTYYVGDFNGDKMDDLLCIYRFPDGSTSILEWQGTLNGINTVWNNKAYYASENFARELGRYYVGDFNGDKKDDLICLYKYPDSSMAILEWLGTSHGISSVWSTKIKYSSGDFARELGKYHIGDFNGDGKDDMVAYYLYPKGNKELQFYACMGRAKLLDPYSYYLMQPWLCWIYGATGSFFWSFVDNGIRYHTEEYASSWNEYSLKTPNSSPFFIDKQSVMSAKQMEATREGVEDYEYFVILKDLIRQGEECNICDSVLYQAKSLLDSIPEIYTKGMVQNNGNFTDFLWEQDLNKDIIDVFRKKILDILVLLKKEIEEINQPKKFVDEIKKNLLEHIGVTPNPNFGILNVTLPSRIEKISITLYSSMGKIEKREIFRDIQFICWDISNLDSGLYILSLEMGEDIVTRKIIKL